MVLTISLGQRERILSLLRAWEDTASQVTQTTAPTTETASFVTVEEFLADAETMFVKGDPIQVISGKYENTRGSFVRYTPQKVWVRLSMRNGPLTTCLWPGSIQKIDAGAEEGTRSISVERPGLGSTPGSSTPQEEVDGTEKLVKGDSIQVVSGKYTNKRGYFIRYTPQKVWVRLHQEDTGPITTCLWPASIQKIDASSLESRSAGEPFPSTRTSNHSSQYLDHDDDDEDGSFQEGDPVQVVAGKYKNRTGRFLRRTPQKMWIEIFHETSGAWTKTCLFPRAIRKTRPLPLERDNNFAAQERHPVEMVVSIRSAEVVTTGATEVDHSSSAQVGGGGGRSSVWYSAVGSSPGIAIVSDEGEAEAEEWFDDATENEYDQSNDRNQRSTGTTSNIGVPWNIWIHR